MEIFGLTFGTRDIWFFGIAGTLALTLIGFQLTNATNQKNRFNQAASTFRSKLLALLEGYYPSIHSSEADDYAKIRATISKVESIAADFSHFLRGSTKSKFHAAVKEYWN